MTMVLCTPGAASWSQYTPNAFNTLKTALGGPQALIEQLGHTDQATMVPIKYNDLDGFNGYRDGAKQIDQMLTAVKRVHPDEPVVLFGHSFGAVANCEYLRGNYTSRQLYAADQLTVVNIGNSIRPNNGLCGILGMYGARGPVSTRFQVYDVAAEFDKWADYPNLGGSPQYWNAVNNVNNGDNYPEIIHVNGYNAIRLTQPHNYRDVDRVSFMHFPSSRTLAPGITKAMLTTAYSRITD